MLAPDLAHGSSGESGHEAVPNVRRSSIPGEAGHSGVVPKNDERGELSHVGRRRVGGWSALGPAAWTRRPTVLLIDHDLVHGESLLAGLSAACQVTRVTDASIALEHIADGARYDVIFSDLVMPHLTGEEFYKRACWAAPELGRRILFMAREVHDDAAEFLGRIPNRCLRRSADPATVLDLVGMMAVPRDPITAG